MYLKLSIYNFVFGLEEQVDERSNCINIRPLVGGGTKNFEAEFWSLEGHDCLFRAGMQTYDPRAACGPRTDLMRPAR